MKLQGIFWRVIVAPFFFMFHLVGSILSSFYTTWFFLKYGGEAFVYKSEKEKHTIKEIWDILREQHETTK